MCIKKIKDKCKKRLINKLLKIENSYKDILKDEKTNERLSILNGRIYPAIQTCVNNRIIILTGILAYVAFLVLEFSKINITLIRNLIKLAPILFIITALHNLGNYSYNNMEECILEKREYVPPKYEIIFCLIVSIISILVSLFLIFDP